MWTYQCRVDRVVDGDTLDLAVDCGFHVTRRIRIRLTSVDTAEIYGVGKDSDEYKRGIEQKQYVESWVDVDGKWPFIVQTGATGKYGRWIATLERKHDGDILNNAITAKFPSTDDD